MTKIMDTIGTVFFRLDRYVAWVETLLLCIALIFLFTVGFYQVTCRELAGSGAVWPEHLLRYSVLVIGFLGASLASRENRNIRIDLITHFLESKKTGKWWQICEGILFLLGTGVSVLMVVATWQYIAVEQMLDMPVPNTNLPAHWIFFVPLVFFSISGLRYFFYGIFKFAGQEIETHMVEKKMITTLKTSGE